MDMANTCPWASEIFPCRDIDAHASLFTRRGTCRDGSSFDPYDPLFGNCRERVGLSHVTEREYVLALHDAFVATLKGEIQ
jgi:hypothetical protein